MEAGLTRTTSPGTHSDSSKPQPDARWVTAARGRGGDSPTFTATGHAFHSPWRGASSEVCWLHLSSACRGRALLPGDQWSLPQGARGPPLRPGGLAQPQASRRSWLRGGTSARGLFAGALTLLVPTHRPSCSPRGQRLAVPRGGLKLRKRKCGGSRTAAWQTSTEGLSRSSRSTSRGRRRSRGELREGVLEAAAAPSACEPAGAGRNRLDTGECKVCPRQERASRSGAGRWRDPGCVSAPGCRTRFS